MNTSNRAGSRADDLQQLRNKIDSDDPFFPGHGIKTGGIEGSRHATRIRRVPRWAKSDTGIRAILLRVFPKLSTNEKHRLQASRWARVIYLYYRAGYTYSEVAEELHVNKNTVHELLKHIRRAIAGKMGNNTALRGARPRGRPKKIVTHSTPPLEEDV